MNAPYLTEDESGGNPTSHPAYSGERTFPAFVGTDVCRQTWGRDPVFYDRLVAASAEIETLAALKRWAKERYPDHYSSDWRKTTGKPYAREGMQRLWAAYLAWKEEAATEH